MKFAAVFFIMGVVALLAAPDLIITSEAEQMERGQRAYQNGREAKEAENCGCSELPCENPGHCPNLPRNMPRRKKEKK